MLNYVKIMSEQELVIQKGTKVFQDRGGSEKSSDSSMDKHFTGVCNKL
jgi:hypothetical protein